ncbi:MAG: T9SS type A sorting domain-containing protein [Owenweeksia sp.]|nr:T9SS type A sorting domain-containing protein [Owenweeksia sp.]
MVLVAAGPTNRQFSKRFDLDASMPGTYHSFDLTSPVGSMGVREPLTLPTGCYYFVLRFLPNGADPIRIGNNTTIEASGDAARSYESVIMETSNGWFSGFTNSTTVENPVMRLELFPTSDISIDELEVKEGSIAVYPNPTEGFTYVNMPKPGDFTLEVLTLTGQVVHTEELSISTKNQKIARDFSALANGVYLIKVHNDGYTGTSKMTIESVQIPPTYHWLVPIE